MSENGHIRHRYKANNHHDPNDLTLARSSSSKPMQSDKRFPHEISSHSQYERHKDGLYVFYIIRFEDV